MRITLGRLTLAVWLAWLSTLIVMACLSHAHVFHPSFLYMAIPLTVQAISTVAVLRRGMWRLACGLRRWNAVTCMLLGVLPALWTAACTQYLYHLASGRNHPPNALTWMANATASLIAEPYVRVCYPYRYEGERFVLWSKSPTCNVKQMAAMDAHIRAMEQSLGGPFSDKVYWVPGPIFGLEGGYAYGWAVTSPWLALASDADGLNSVDQHEVAHFVLDEAIHGSEEELAKLLNEGWAELHSGRETQELRQACWLAQRQGALFSLRELTSPTAYYNSARPMYSQGCVLVDYLLRRFGAAKFLELCRTCSQATFAADVQRVLGLSLDELDQAYQQDFAQQDSPDKKFLLSAKLADGVDPSRWRRFVDDYCAGVERLRAQFRQSSVTMVRTFDSLIQGEHKTVARDHIEYFRDDRRWADCMRDLAGETFLHISTWDAEFILKRDHADQPWQFGNSSTENRRKNLDACVVVEDPKYLAVPLELLERSPYTAGITTTITGIRMPDADSRLARISFERSFHQLDESAVERGWWDLDPGRDFGLVEARSEYPGGQRLPKSSTHIAVDYQTIGGKHVPKVARQETVNSAGSGLRTDTVESCRFGPPRPEVFELATYGDLHPPKSPKQAPLGIGILTWIAGGCTLLALLLALAGLLRRSVPFEPAEDGLC